MRRWGRCGIASVLWIGVLALPPMAFIPRPGQTVVVSEALRDDVYLAGGNSQPRGSGALQHSADQPIEIQPGAQISGGTTQMPAVSRPGRVVTSPFSPRRWLWRSIAEVIALLVLGVFVFAISPKGASAVVAEVRGRFGHSLLTGFVLLVTIPVASMVRVFTVIGIPLSLIGMLLYLATLYPGLIFVAAWVGDRVLQRVRKRDSTSPSPCGVLVVGTIALPFLFSVAWAGWLIRLVAVLAGFGALWAVWRGVTGHRSTAQPSPA